MLYLTMIEKNPKKFLTFWNDERELLLERDKEGFRAIDAGPLTMGYRASNSRTPNGWERGQYSSDKRGIRLGDRDDDARAPVLPSRHDISPQGKIDAARHDEGRVRAERRERAESGRMPRVRMDDVDPTVADEATQLEYGSGVRLECGRRGEDPETRDGRPRRQRLVWACRDGHVMPAPH